MARLATAEHRLIIPVLLLVTLANAQLQRSDQGQDGAASLKDHSNDVANCIQDQGMLTEQHIEEFSPKHFPKPIPGHKQYLAPSTLLIQEHTNTHPYKALIILVPTQIITTQTKPHYNHSTHDILHIFSRPLIDPQHTPTWLPLQRINITNLLDQHCLNAYHTYQLLITVSPQQDQLIILIPNCSHILKWKNLNLTTLQVIPTNNTNTLTPLAIATHNIHTNTTHSYNLYALQAHNYYNSHTTNITTIQIYKAPIHTHNTHTSWQHIKSNNDLNITNAANLSHVTMAVLNSSILVIAAMEAQIPKNSTYAVEPGSLLQVWNFSLTKHNWTINGTPPAKGEISQTAFTPSINTILIYKHFGQVNKNGVLGTCKLNIEEETQLLAHCQYWINLPRVFTSETKILPKSYILTSLAHASESYLINTAIGTTYKVRFHQDGLNPDITLHEFSQNAIFTGGFGCNAPQPVVAHEPKIEQQQQHHIWIFGGDCDSPYDNGPYQARTWYHTMPVRTMFTDSKNRYVFTVRHISPGPQAWDHHYGHSATRLNETTAVIHGGWERSTWCFDLHDNYWTKLTHQPSTKPPWATGHIAVCLQQNISSHLRRVRGTNTIDWQ